MLSWYGRGMKLKWKTPRTQLGENLKPETEEEAATHSLGKCSVCVWERERGREREREAVVMKAVEEEAVKRKGMGMGNTGLWVSIKNKRSGPGQRGSAGERCLKTERLRAWIPSGPIPRLWVWSLVQVCMGGNQSMLPSHIGVSLPSSFSKNNEKNALGP